MKTKSEEHVGKVFGNLTALSVLSKSKHTKMLCQCSCGKECVVAAGHLVSGHTKSCGCMKKRTIELSGQVFGRLTVVRFCGTNKYGTALWLCECSCGCSITTTSQCLRRGYTTSCGCYHRERSSKHGLYKHSEYGVWNGMLNRCLSELNPCYPNYGGRGITVCDEWLCFENFLSDMGPRPSKDHSIDRINNDGPYCKENCRWATRKEQCNNRRSNVYVCFNGESHTVPEWSEIVGINARTLYTRLDRGWSPEEALSTPPDSRRVGTTSASSVTEKFPANTRIDRDRHV